MGEGMKLRDLIVWGVFPPIWRRLAADVAALINGTTAQALLVYNTFTSDTVYERAFIRWSSNVAEVGTEHVGATLRSLRLLGNTVLINIAGVSKFSFTASALQPSTDASVSLGTTSLRLINAFFSGYVRLGSTTVAALPVAATAGAGARIFVTDALAPTFGATVVGGGAVFIPVHCDGSAWKVG